MSADCQSLEKKPRHLRRWKDLIEARCLSGAYANYNFVNDDNLEYETASGQRMIFEYGEEDIYLTWIDGNRLWGQIGCPIECSETYGPEFVRKFFETEAANVD